jgi:hypothetical protein
MTSSCNIRTSVEEGEASVLDMELLRLLYEGNASVKRLTGL